MDEIMIRVMRLAGQGLHCSQILGALALETRGGSNPELIRALAGLAYGCGTGRGTCGALSGAACVLGLYAGKGGPGEEESPALALMLEELTDWFATQTQEQGEALTCEGIIGVQAGRTQQRICGNLVAGAFVKIMELLQTNGIDPLDPGENDAF